MTWSRPNVGIPFPAGRCGHVACHLPAPQLGAVLLGAAADGAGGADAAPPAAGRVGGMLIFGGMNNVYCSGDVWVFAPLGGAATRAGAAGDASGVHAVDGEELGGDASAADAAAVSDGGGSEAVGEAMALPRALALHSRRCCFCGVHRAAVGAAAACAGAASAVGSAQQPPRATAGARSLT